MNKDCSGCKWYMFGSWAAACADCTRGATIREDRFEPKAPPVERVEFRRRQMSLQTRWTEDPSKDEMSNAMEELRKQRRLDIAVRLAAKMFSCTDILYIENKRLAEMAFSLADELIKQGGI